MTKTKRNVLIGTAIVVLAIAAIIWYIFTETFDDTKTQKPDYTVDAMAFIKEFQQDNIAANKKYTEKIVAINGTISEVETADTTANIKMTDAASGDYIIFAFQQQHVANAKALKRGQMVSIKGSCSGGVHSQILETNYISFKRAALNK